MQQLSKQFELVAISSHFFTDIYTFNITNAVNCSISIDFICVSTSPCFSCHTSECLPSTELKPMVFPIYSSLYSCTPEIKHLLLPKTYNIHPSCLFFVRIHYNCTLEQKQGAITNLQDLLPKKNL